MRLATLEVRIGDPWKRAELVVEKARKEEGRAFRAASLRDHVCED